jgi:hypothetical protein
MRLRAVLAGLLLGSIPGLALAGETACRIENGVVVVPAMAAGVNGQFVLDTGAAQSQIDATQASEVPILTDPVTGPVRLAGRTLAAVTMAVLPLDARTRRFVIPISGVLGSDVLAGLVVDLEPSPCRLRLSEPGHERRFRARVTLPVDLRGGVPFIGASVFDGRTGKLGAFRIDTGSAFPATLSPAAAKLLTPSGDPPPPKSTAPGTLRALGFGQMAFQNQTAGLKADIPAPALGAIGAPIWARFRMRLDYVRRRLSLAPLNSTQGAAVIPFSQREKEGPAPRSGVGG